jgi:hypothetical protein
MQNDNVNIKPSVLNIKYIVLAYIILPVTLLFFAIDYFFFQLSVTRSLPADPHRLTIFIVVFMTPHIFAGSAPYFSREYIKRYKVMLISVVSISVVVPLLFIQIIGIKFFMPFVALFGLQHFLAQQFGIFKSSLVEINWRYHFWYGMGLSFFFFAFLTLSPDAPLKNKEFANYVITALCVIYLFSFYLLFKQIKPGWNLLFGVGNTALIFNALFFTSIGYEFYGILGLRIIHDVTAFLVYYHHDAGRTLHKKKNKIYNIIPLHHKYLRFLYPLFFILVGLPYTFVIFPAFPLIMAFVAFFHYISEAIVWKQKSLHRQYMVFSS